jgi:hypothetical protein
MTKLHLSISSRAIILYVFWLFFSILIAKQLNFYHAELDVYLPHYLSGENWLKLIFNPIAELDFTNSTFRGREFGSLLNYFDSLILANFYKIGIFSTVYYLIIGLLLLFTHSYFFNSVKKNEMNDNILILVLFNLLLLSSSPVLLGGVFYRSNKIAASVFIAVAILLYFTYKENKVGGVVKNVILSFACVAAALSDEQGFAYLCFMSFYAFFDKFLNLKSKTDNIYIVLFSLTVVLFYRFLIGPWIYSNFNPNLMTDNIIDLNYQITIDNIINSMGLFSRYLSFLLGNITERSSIVLILISFLYLYIRDFRVPLDKFSFYLIAALLLFTIGCLLVIFVMIQKHPAILWRDIVSYYSLPQVFVFYSLIYMFVGVGVKNGIFNKLRVVNVLVVLIFCNILSLSNNYQLLVSGHMKWFRHSSSIVDASLVNEDLIKRSILLSIDIPGAVDGKREDMHYGVKGVEVLRRFHD